MMIYKNALMILGGILVLIFLDVHGIQNASAENQYSVEIARFDKIELGFTSTTSYANPYTNVSLSAQITSPSGDDFKVDGFWDGSDIWRIRIMPTEIGEYTYITQSDDPDLNGKSGSFTCVESDHPGLLMVNPEYPYTFKLSRGGPFFWMGETSWLMMSDAVSFSNNVFQKMIDARISQKFNGVHFVLGTGGLPIGTDNPKNEGGNLWVSQENQQINPGFFQWMDRRVEYLHEKKMVLGFFITWAQHYSQFSKEEYERLERYLIARYGAYPLLYWVIVGEFDESGKISDYNHHGEFIDQHDPYGHLISNHPGHSDADNLGTSRIFAGEPWFDFIIQQFPDRPAHYSPEDIYEAAIEDRNFNMPVVNIEFGYEDMQYDGKVFTEDLVRKSAWATVMAGGFPGYGHGETIRTVDTDYLDAPGTRYMTNLHNFFENLRWWEMQPKNALIDNGFCLARGKTDYVIYLPEGGTVNVDLRKNFSIYLTKWYNPQTGSYNETQKIVGGSVHSCQAPFNDDAVLFLHSVANPVISVEPDTLSFNIMKWDSSEYTETVTINNTGGDTLVWNAVEQPDELWLVLHNNSGTAGDQLIVSVDATALEEGSYSGTVGISAENAENSPVYIYVEVNVQVETAELAVAQRVVDFGSTNDSVRIMIMNSGDAELSWNIDTSGLPRWIASVVPQQGMLQGGESQQIVLTANRNNILSGNYVHDILIQTDYNDVTVTVKFTQPNTDQYIVRINCGSSLDYRDKSGKLWQADKPYAKDSWGYIGGSTFSTSDPIANTEDDLLYQSERWDMSGYNFDVQNGLYEVTLLFAEIYFRESGSRVFNVYLEENEVLHHFDIFAAVGHDYATSRTFIAEVDDNQLNIKFGKVVEDWKLAAVKVVQKKTQTQDQVAESFILYQNYPNPFKLSTSIAFDLPYTSSLKIDIYNVLGQKIKSDIFGPFSEGYQQFTWQAIDASGKMLPSGMYFYKIKMLEQQKSTIQYKKMIIKK